MIGIIDYDAGNLKSVEKAFQFLGYNTIVSNDANKLEKTQAIVLPGVGAFKEAINNLVNNGMDEFVKYSINKGKPFLGICLGLQLLFDVSYESGEHKGLGILPGEIKLIPESPGLKVPHMGWNKLQLKKDCSLFNGISKESYVYFVHSYYLDAGDKQIVTATSKYGVEIDAAVNKENVFATQFHPEKSSKTGLKMLENFAKVAKVRKGD